MTGLNDWVDINKQIMAKLYIKNSGPLKHIWTVEMLQHYTLINDTGLHAQVASEHCIEQACESNRTFWS